MDKRLLLLIGIAAIAFIAILFVEPIPQNNAYHNFADKRVVFSIPYFFNVISNLPFVWVGIKGIRLARLGDPFLRTNTLSFIYLVFFVGVLLTGLGSAYYHLHPTHATLLWDRLPMTISFSAFFSIVVAKCIDIRLAQRLLFILLGFGIGSVVYWYLTELSGRGDLRPYILVQFLPITLLPLILWLFEGIKKDCLFAWVVIATYIVAKIFEALDTHILHVLGVISGHTIKHLIAGYGTYVVLQAYRKHSS
jgi:hypothetical protein